MLWLIVRSYLELLAQGLYVDFHGIRGYIVPEHLVAFQIEKTAGRRDAPGHANWSDRKPLSQGACRQFAIANDQHCDKLSHLRVGWRAAPGQGLLCLVCCRPDERV
jgi:hypothetical protein